MQNFAELHLKPETLARYGLPDIPYPSQRPIWSRPCSTTGIFRWPRCCSACNNVAGMGRPN